MGGSDASHLYLRSGAASGVTPLGLSATYTAQAAGRRTSTQHDAKKARMKETRLGKCGRGDSHAEGGGACTRPTKKNTTPARRRAPAALATPAQTCHNDGRRSMTSCTTTTTKTYRAASEFATKLRAAVPFGAFRFSAPPAPPETAGYASGSPRAGEHSAPVVAIARARPRDLFLVRPTQRAGP